MAGETFVCLYFIKGIENDLSADLKTSSNHILVYNLNKLI